MGGDVPPELLPPGLRAQLIVFLPTGQVVPAPGHILPKLASLGVEGISPTASFPSLGCLMLRVPLLLPGSRLKAILSQLLPRGGVVREVRELLALVEVALATCEELGWPAGSHLAMVDNLGRGEVGRTMVEIQRSMEEGLAPRGFHVAILSHFDLLLSRPPLEGDLETLGETHGLALGGRPLAVSRPLDSLTTLRPLLSGGRPGEVA